MCSIRPSILKQPNIFMAVFIVHWPCLLTIKLSCLQKYKLGHAKVPTRTYNYCFCIMKTPFVCMISCSIIQGLKKKSYSKLIGLFLNMIVHLHFGYQLWLSLTSLMFFSNWFFRIIQIICHSCWNKLILFSICSGWKSN